MSTGLGNVLIVANCDQTYHGAGIGFWWHFCLADRPTPPGDRSSQEIAYRKIAVRYVRGHADRLPAVVWARLGRTFGFFRPDQQLHYDEQVETRNIVPPTAQPGVDRSHDIRTVAVTKEAMNRHP